MSDWKSDARKVIENLALIRTLYAEIDAIQTNCRHEFQKREDSPWCPKCQLHLTCWWCDASPTKACVYSVTYDACDYCGKPEDRG